jgi:hypothetical protein
MTARHHPLPSLLLLLAATAVHAAPATRPATQPAAKPLFPEAGVPKGWSARLWSDVAKPAPDGTDWRVDDAGVLHCNGTRGSWLVSDAEFGDFVLSFEFKLPERGNSGIGIRFPAAGDPAFDGIEIQMADERYNEGRDGPDKLTGSLYKALAPTKQVFKPTEWNRYVITATGPRVRVELNRELIQDANLDEQKAAVERHDGKPAPPLKERPRRGRIGFQELSRGGGHVMIRNATITVAAEAGR